MWNAALDDEVAACQVDQSIDYKVQVVYSIELSTNKWLASPSWIESAADIQTSAIVASILRTFQLN